MNSSTYSYKIPFPIKDTHNKLEDKVDASGEKILEVIEEKIEENINNIIEDSNNQDTNNKGDSGAVLKLDYPDKLPGGSSKESITQLDQMIKDHYNKMEQINKNSLEIQKDIDTWKKELENKSKESDQKYNDFKNNLKNAFNKKKPMTKTK